MCIRGEKVNPTSVARALIDRWPNTYPRSKLNALRQRTEADLARVSTLEKLVVKGFTDPIWQKFDLAAALDELDAVTPYTP